MMTAVAFSTSKPFRKPIYTNYYFFVCVVFLFVFDTFVVFLPSSSGVDQVFNLMPFVNKDTGDEYYSYRFWIAGGIVVNSFMTYFAELFIVRYVTSKYDHRGKVKKQQRFLEQMEFLRLGARGGDKQVDVIR